jgi:hypothetical protein
VGSFVAWVYTEDVCFAGNCCWCCDVTELCFSHASDAKAAMEFRCLRAHLAQMDLEWIRGDGGSGGGRYSKKPVDKLLMLVRV